MQVTHSYVSAAPPVAGKVDSVAWNAAHVVTGVSSTDLTTDFVLTPDKGGTGVANAAGSTLTLGAATTITGGGTIALGGFTLTVPATGTAALRGADNTFTGANTFDQTITMSGDNDAIQWGGSSVRVNRVNSRLYMVGYAGLDFNMVFGGIGSYLNSWHIDANGNMRVGVGLDGDTVPARLLVTERTTITNAVKEALRVEATVSTTSTGGAAGFGVGHAFYAETATDGTNQQQGQIATAWVDATNATRKAYMTLSAYDTAAREGMRIQASGTAAQLGFFGATPVVQPANTDAIDTALVNLGLRASGGDALFTARVREPGTFAGIYVADASTAQSIPTGTTYTKVTLFATNGLSSNCTADATNDKITITKAGTYYVCGTFSMQSGTNNVEFKGALFYDNVEQSNIHWERKIGTAGDVGNASFMGFISAAANKDIDVRVRHDNAGSIDFTLTYANLTVIYVGE